MANLWSRSSFSSSASLTHSLLVSCCRAAAGLQTILAVAPLWPPDPSFSFNSFPGRLLEYLFLVVPPAAPAPASPGQRSAWRGHWSGAGSRGDSGWHR